MLRNKALRPSPHIRFPGEGDSSSSYTICPEDDSSLHSPTSVSSLSWLSSTSLDSTPSTDTDTRPDLFAPFKPHPPDLERVSTPVLDTLLTTCNNREFLQLWPVRRSRHDTWCRQSSAEHQKQLMVVDGKSPHATWPPKYGPYLTMKPNSNPPRPVSISPPYQTPARMICGSSTPTHTSSSDFTCPPSHPSPVNPKLPQRWHKDFMCGCKLTDDRALNDCAIAVFTKGTWQQTSSIQLLADGFRSQYCEQYSEPWLSEKAKVVVPFLVAIHSCFDKKLGPDIANSFQSCVQQSTMDSFQLMWNSHQPCCVTSPESTSSDIKQALGLSRYVGALYQSSLLSDYNIQLAISALLNNLRIIEQIQALHYLITETGERLWQTAESRIAMEAWSKTLESKMSDSTTVIYSAEGKCRVVNFELIRWINHVVDKIRKQVRKHHKKHVVEGFSN